MRAVRAAAGQRPDAAQLITAFSRPGELVVIPAAGTARSWPPPPRRAACPRPDPRPGRVPAAGPAGLAGLDPAARPLARLRPGGPALLLAPGNPDAGQAALAITGRPGAPRRAGGVLYAACERVLRPGGVLAVITASPAGPAGCATTRRRASVAAARAAGLVYAQHIVLVHAAIDGDRLAPARRAAARTGSRARPCTPASTPTCWSSPSPEEPRR